MEHRLELLRPLALAAGLVTASASPALAQADLWVPDISVTEAIAFRGGTITVALDIGNQGTVAADNFAYDFYLSTNELISSISDPHVGTVTGASVPAGSQISVSHTLTISSTITAGEYYLGVILDQLGAVTESSSTNNIRRTPSKIIIRDPGADFAFSQLAAPTTVAIGEAFPVQRVVSNLGNAAGTASYELWLSSDATLDAADLRVLSSTISIASGQDDSGNDFVTLTSSVTPGSYRLIYVADPANAVDELYETNNVGLVPETVTVLPQSLQILTESLPFATIGVPYGAGLAAEGGTGPLTWSVPSGSLPAGIQLDASSGALSGTPTSEGLSILTLEVSDGSARASRTLRILVSEQSATLEVLTQTLPVGYVNRSYQFILTAHGGVPPLTWSNAGSVPGFTVSSAGVISGLPTSTGFRNFRLQVRDARGEVANANLNVRVLEDDANVRLSAAGLPDGRLGDPYSAQIAVEPDTGTMPYVYELVGGSLPPGLSFSVDSITGTPTEVGEFQVSFRVTDSYGQQDTNRYTIEVTDRNGVLFLTNALPSATVGTEYMDASGKTVSIEGSSTQPGAISFDLVSGSLPFGLTMTSSGAISGTPTRRGTYDFVVRATDGAKQETLRAFAILVQRPVETGEISEVSSGGCTCARPSESWGQRALAFALLPMALVVGLRRRKVWAAAAAALVTLGAFGGTAQAQSQYVVLQQSQPYVTRSAGGTTIRFSSTDDGQATVTLPFAVDLFGQSYSTVNVSTNGYVVMGTGSATAYSNVAIPSTSTPNGYIAPWWDDLSNANATANTTYVEGTAPNRRFIVQLQGLQRLGNSGGGTLQMQVHFVEGRRGFEVHYGGILNGGGANFWSATTGFETADGSSGQYFLTSCSSSCVDTNFPNNVVYSVYEDAGLNVSSDSVSTPTVLYPGSSSSVTVEISSLHRNPIGPFDVALSIRPDTTGSTGTTMATVTTSLSAYERKTLTIPFTVPTGLSVGRYRLDATVDSAGIATETDETDNVASSGSIRVQAPLPDVTARAVTTNTASAAPGGSVGFSATLVNDGGLSATASWIAVLSQNAVVSRTDRVIGSGSQLLQPTGTASIAQTLTLPTDLTPGIYTVGIVVDPEGLVDEVSELNNAITAPVALAVSEGTLAIDQGALPPAYQNLAYTYGFKAVGGDGNESWRINSSPPPTGLFLDPQTGILSGVPTMVESATFTVQVASGNQTASRTVTLDVVKPVGDFAILTRSLLAGTVGADYPPTSDMGTVQRIEAIGGTDPVTFTLPTSAPPGLTLASDGLLSGIPTQAGRYTLDVTATDATGMTATRELVLTVGSPGQLMLVTDTLPTAYIRQAYQTQLRAVGTSTNATLTYSTTGPLPTGIRLGSTGVLAGSPTVTGTFEFPVTVSEGTGRQSDTALFRLVVDTDDALRFRISGSTTSTVGVPVDVELVAVGGTGPYAWAGQSNLPDELDAEITGGQTGTMVITGALSEVGVAPVLITLRDSDGRIYQEAVTFTFLPEVVDEPDDQDDDSGCTATGSAAPGAFSWLMLGSVGLWGLRRRRRR